jgi:hypothetical protein
MSNKKMIFYILSYVGYIKVNNRNNSNNHGTRRNEETRREEGK